MVIPSTEIGVSGISQRMKSSQHLFCKQLEVYNFELLKNVGRQSTEPPFYLVKNILIQFSRSGDGGGRVPCRRTSAKGFWYIQ